MSFQKLAEDRTSVRKYSNKKPKIEDIIRCINVANLAPSPGNLPLMRFIIVEDSDKIEKIADACQQQFIKQAQVVVVVCSDLKDAKIMYDKRANKYVKQHAGALIENFLLNAVDIGLASCWVGAYSDMMLKNLLKIPDEIDIEAVLPVGYTYKTDETKHRKKPEIENRLYFETWKNKFRKPFPKMTD